MDFLIIQFTRPQGDCSRRGQKGLRLEDGPGGAGEEEESGGRRGRETKEGNGKKEEGRKKGVE